jgi:hypothetical protein
MEGLVKDAFTLYGPLAIGWLVAVVLGWRLWFDTSKVLATDKALRDLIMEYHDVIVANTKVTERLAFLIEERSRIQSERQNRNG